MRAVLRHGRLPAAGAGNGGGAATGFPPPPALYRGPVGGGYGTPVEPLPAAPSQGGSRSGEPRVGLRATAQTWGAPGRSLASLRARRRPKYPSLQRLAAGVLGMEDALFVPTATMANLMAMMCHCQRRGAQLLLGRDAHLQLFEYGGAAQVAGVHSQSLPDLPDGTFDLDQLELTVRQAHGSRHHPLPELLCLENTHSSAGGVWVPQPVWCWLDLGFVAEAWRMQKLLERGMRQAGELAAPACLGLQQAEAMLHRDHDNVQHFAKGIQELNSPLFSVNLVVAEMNIVMVSIRGGWPSPTELCERLQAVSEEEMAETGQAVSILMFPWSAHTVRAVWHRDVSVHDTKLAKNKLEFVARKCREKLSLGLHPTPLNTGEA